MRADRQTSVYARVITVAAWLVLGVASNAAAAETARANSAVIDSGHFAEPLVKTSETKPAEDEALADAIQAYVHRARPDDLTALTGFLASYPHTGWSAAIWTNLGLSYLHYGYFSRALDAWGKAWLEGRDASTADARLLVDRAIGEQARLYASLGQFDQLQRLFDDIGSRPIAGSATEAVQEAREELLLVKKDPRHLYLCGPMALKALLLARGASYDQVRWLDRYRATPKGTSLATVAKLATELKLNYRIVFRRPGQPIPDQAIVHWKVGHFAAIIGHANGRIHVADPVFPGEELWITPAAMDAEASGYMLVPIDNDIKSWRAASDQEAGMVWGKGPTSGTQPGRPGGPPANPPPAKPCPLCLYNIAESTVALTLSDVPVGYDPPIGPSTKATISYDQREDSQPANFSYFNVGQKWTLNWLTYITDDPTNPGANVSRFMAGGGAFYYSGYDGATGRFPAQDTDGSILVLGSQVGGSYKLQMPDGAVEVYSHSDGATSYPRTIFLTDEIDPQGNALHFTYDANQRLIDITDATGRHTTLSYEIASRPNIVTKITDPFGRSAKLAYDGYGRLISITDIIGLTSRFSYDANSLVNVLTTPYGTTTFAYTAPGTSGPPRFLDVTDPLGNHEREEWLEPAPVDASDPANTVPVGMPLTPENDFHQYRDSFHWDKDQYISAGCAPAGGCDYSKARNTHFAHYGNLKSNTIESIKEPLENRVWYQYPGQPDSYHTGTYDKPIAIARVLDDGSTQLRTFSYDTAGYFYPTQAVDPIGRTTNIIYANHIDIQAVTQKTENGNTAVIAQYTYNGRHRILSKVDAAGQLTTFRYNPAGQLVAMTDPLLHETQYTYDGNGNLSQILNANAAIARAYTFDAYNRVATASDSEGWQISYSYDAADRPVQMSYPDGTSERLTYNKLELASFQDRLGRTWRYGYDANGNLTTITDPLGHQSLLSYSPNGHLTSLTDFNGNATKWAYDIQGRLISKQYADNSALVYSYEGTTSRIKSRTDALGQIKNYTYDIDDLIKNVSYVNAVNPTPSVSYSYDPFFARIVSMTDGVGVTQYKYGAVGEVGGLLVSQSSGPLAAATIDLNYDELGRVVSRTVAGSGPEGFQYDALGRLSSHTSDLGTFAYSYLGQTGQMVARSLNGSGAMLKTTWNYLSNVDDRRLSEVDNFGLTASQYSKFVIASDASGQITSVDENSDTASVYPGASSQSASYNNLNQITNLSGQNLSYDGNGNLTSDGIRTYNWDAESRLVEVDYVAQPGKSTTFSYDGLNRRISIGTISAGGGSPVVTSYLWCGDAPCQARDATGSTVREYFSEGEFLSGVAPASYYYGVDQIGSVRRVFASAAEAPAYSYDPYGNPLQGTAALTDYRYAGLFFNTDSDLGLTLYRAYRPGFGRWLSRDPLGETADGGRNLYTYANGDPLNLVDPLGLCGDKPSKQDCISRCAELTLPTRNHGGSFDQCVAHCTGKGRHPQWDDEFPDLYPPNEGDNSNLKSVAAVGAAALVVGAGLILVPEVTIPALVIGGAAAR